MNQESLGDSRGLRVYGFGDVQDANVRRALRKPHIGHPLLVPNWGANAITNSTDRSVFDTV